MKKNYLKTIFGRVEVSPYCDVETLQKVYDDMQNPLNLISETHAFRHYCESGNVLIGFATLQRLKSTKLFTGVVIWRSTASQDLTLSDRFERDLGWIPEVSVTLQNITGRELEFKPNKKPKK